MNQLSDENYLVATDFPILLNELIKQINQKKPENPWQYSAIYFKKVQQCIHILGEDYLTIVSCRHNRRSFVYCCQQSFKHFISTELISVNDYYSLLQLICPDIPLSLIHDSAITGCISHHTTSTIHDSHLPSQHPFSTSSSTPLPPSSSSSSSSSQPLILYTFEEISYSLYFRFIFTEWLIMIENLFFDGTIKTRKSSATVTISIQKLQNKLLEWSTATSSVSTTTSQPSQSTLKNIYSQWAIKKKTEITFDELIQTLLQNSSFKAEIVSYQPKLSLPGPVSGPGPGDGTSNGKESNNLDQLLCGLSLSSSNGRSSGVGAIRESDHPNPSASSSSSQQQAGTGTGGGVGGALEATGSFSSSSSTHSLSPPTNTLPGIK